jgi:hypothetical protein
LAVENGLIGTSAQDDRKAGGGKPPPAAHPGGVEGKTAAASNGEGINVRTPTEFMTNRSLVSKKWLPPCDVCARPVSLRIVCRRLIVRKKETYPFPNPFGARTECPVTFLCERCRKRAASRRLQA